MPTLAVTDNTGRLSAGADFHIWATMLVPDGPSNQRWHLHVAAQAATEAMARNPDGLAIDRATFLHLYNAGRQAVEDDQWRRQRDGEQVGEILLVIRTLSRDRPEIASLGKAIRLHAESMGQFDGEPLLRAESKLRAAWKDFGPVAHLWGAYRLLLRSKELGIGSDLDYTLLLAIAEHLRIWGEGHRSPVGRTGTGRTSEPLLPPSMCWRTPPSATLPSLDAIRLDRLQLGWRANEMIQSTPA